MIINNNKWSITEDKLFDKLVELNNNYANGDIYLDKYPLKIKDIAIGAKCYLFLEGDDSDGYLQDLVALI